MEYALCGEFEFGLRWYESYGNCTKSFCQFENYIRRMAGMSYGCQQLWRMAYDFKESPESDTNAKCDSDTNTESDSNTDTEGNGDTNTKSDSDTDTKSNGNTNTEGDGDTNTKSDSNTNTNEKAICQSDERTVKDKRTGKDRETNANSPGG